MKTLVAILTSGKIEKLQRCIDSVLLQAEPVNIVVVINTLDERYENLASFLSAEYGIESVITESNGKPGKGKNSLMRHFLDTEFTHVIPVDGDDFLMPDALSSLEDTAIQENADVIGLVDGLALYNNRYLKVEEWLCADEYFDRVLDSIAEKDLKKFNLHIEKIRRTSTEHSNFFNRLVMISKKAAKLISYDEEMGGAEDVRQSLLLKLAHYDGIIRYVLLSSEHVYIHDVTSPGVFFQVLCKCDPTHERKLFWNNITVAQINTLKSFQLECVNDQNRFSS